MKVEYSKQFVKASYKLSGKYKLSLQKVISEVKKADHARDISNCIKMVNLPNTYRIKMGDYRIVFIIRILEQLAIFELLLSRGEVYNKEYEYSMKKKG